MKQWIAALLALSMIAALSGCTARKSPNTSKNDAPPAQQETPKEPAPPKEEPPAPPSEPSKPEEPEEPKEAPSDPKEEDKPQSSVPANPAAVTEFSSYSSLDSTKMGWGPGGPVDEWNRSQGALAYQEKYGKYDADFIGKNEKKIYLTFDEGYENGYTAEILDVLKEKKCPAVFFLTGPYAKSQPDLVKRMIDEGHILGNHSVNHPSFPETPLEVCKNEVSELHDYVKENFGYEMNLFRFPMGEFNEQDLKLMQDMGYRSVFWSFAYRDWIVDDQPALEDAKNTMLSKAHPGAIYLLHAVSKTNTQVLGDVIDELRAQGYEFARYEGNDPVKPQ